MEDNDLDISLVSGSNAADNVASNDQSDSDDDPTLTEQPSNDLDKFMNTDFLPVKTWLLMACSTTFYAIITI